MRAKKVVVITFLTDFLQCFRYRRSSPAQCAHWAPSPRGRVLVWCKLFDKLEFEGMGVICFYYNRWRGVGRISDLVKKSIINYLTALTKALHMLKYPQEIYQK